MKSSIIDPALVALAPIGAGADIDFAPSGLPAGAGLPPLDLTLSGESANFVLCRSGEGATRDGCRANRERPDESDCDGLMGAGAGTGTETCDEDGEGEGGACCCCWGYEFEVDVVGEKGMAKVKGDPESDPDEDAAWVDRDGTLRLELSPLSSRSMSISSSSPLSSTRRFLPGLSTEGDGRSSPPKETVFFLGVLVIPGPR